MSTTEPERADTARRAFDAVAAAQTVTSVETLNQALGQAFGHLGFTSFVMVTAQVTRDGPSLSFDCGSYHEAWVEHYQASNYAPHDAMLAEVLRSGEPLFWSDLPKRRRLAPMSQRIIDEAREFGYRDGIAVPVFHPDGTVSSVAGMGSHIDAADPDVRAAGHLLSLHYAAVARRLLRAGERPRPRLSHRQVECLLWARQGKSSTDIGDILGLSAHTVNEYIATACMRLGVRTRAQAITEAALHGFLAL